MKKLILIIALLSTISFGQPILTGLFADLEGNMRDVSGLWFNTIDNDVINVLGGKTTLTQSGVQVQDILNGNLTADIIIYSATPQLTLYDTDNETGAAVDTSAIIIEADGIPSIMLYDTNGRDVGFTQSGFIGQFRSNGAVRWQYTETYFGTGSTNRPGLSNSNSSLIVPTVLPIRGDTDQGIGGVTDTLSLISGGVSQLKASVNGIMVGFPVGAYKGVGTINAKAVYDDNVLLTDYVFSDSYNGLTIEEMERFYKKNKHLPTIQTWKKEEDRPSVGSLLTQIYKTVELQATYIVELKDRISKLENK